MSSITNFMEPVAGGGADGGAASTTTSASSSSTITSAANSITSAASSSSAEAEAKRVWWNYVDKIAVKESDFGGELPKDANLEQLEKKCKTGTGPRFFIPHGSTSQG